MYIPYEHLVHSNEDAWLGSHANPMRKSRYLLKYVNAPDACLKRKSISPKSLQSEWVTYNSSTENAAAAPAKSTVQSQTARVTPATSRTNTDSRMSRL